MRHNKTLFFRDNPLVRGLATSDIALIDAHSKVFDFKPRQILWNENEVADRVVWIRSGIVGLTRLCWKDRLYVHDIVPSGSVLGEIGLFQRHQVYTATSRERVTGLSIERDAFDAVMRRNPNVHQRVASLLSERASFHIRWHAFLMHRSIRARLAGTLLRLAKPFGEAMDSGAIRINLKISHRELGGFVGATREATSAAISQLKADRVIDSEGKIFLIVDPVGLKALISSPS